MVTISLQNGYIFLKRSVGEQSPSRLGESIFGVGPQGRRYPTGEALPHWRVLIAERDPTIATASDSRGFLSPSSDLRRQERAAQDNLPKRRA